MLALLLELARLQPRRYRVTIDRDTRRLDAVLVTVGNTSSIGGGMRLTPDAKPDDGLLDVLVATPLSRPRKFSAVRSPVNSARALPVTRAISP